VQASEGESSLISHQQALNVLPGQWMRDPYVYLHSDGNYYMTCTRLGNITGGVQGIEVWRSNNLRDWQSVGVPWSFADSSWIQSVERRPGDEKSEFWLWAPELHFLNDKWLAVHTTNRRRANLLVSDGPLLDGRFSEPVGPDFGHRHDPSIFTDDDGSPWLVWACARIARLKPDFSGLAEEEISIGPSDRKLGHEGCVIRKIAGKYVLFGTAWSTDELRRGTYNLYYCTADNLIGPYGPRRFAGRFCGHGTPFQDKQGRWWTTAFMNGKYERSLERGQQICMDNQAWTFNARGMTLVPLEVTVVADGDVSVRAKPEPYATPGPEEVQKFDLLSEPVSEIRSRVASHKEAFQILDEKVRDPFISRGPSGSYYLKLNRTGVPAGREGKKPWDQ
jgi:arylsulfatase